jgi:NTE family protein
MKNILRLLGIMKPHRVGLALGSGGAKGIAHIAVIEHLESLGIPVHCIAGSSIGAMVGAIYAAGGMARLKEDLRRITTRELLTYFDPVFPRSGLIEGRRLKEYLSLYIPRGTKIEDLSIPLGIIATDLSTGKPVVFRSGSVVDAVRASISIPGVFEPVCFNDTALVDGGVANPLPIDIVKGMGASLVVAVNLHPSLKEGLLRRKTRKADYPEINSEDISPSKKQADLSGLLVEKTSGWKWLRSVEQWIGSGAEKRRDEGLPNIFEVLSQSIDIMELVNTRAMITYNPPTVLIEPAVLDIPTLDFKRAGEIMDKGAAAAKDATAALTRRVKNRL